MTKPRKQAHNWATMVTGEVPQHTGVRKLPTLVFCTMAFSKQIFEFGFEFHEGQKS
jgi:hypothetical protein